MNEEKNSVEAELAAALAPFALLDEYDLVDSHRKAAVLALSRYMTRPNAGVARAPTISNTDQPETKCVDEDPFDSARYRLMAEEQLRGHYANATRELRDRLAEAERERDELAADDQEAENIIDGLRKSHAEIYDRAVQAEQERDAAYEALRTYGPRCKYKKGCRRGATLLFYGWPACSQHGVPHPKETDGEKPTEIHPSITAAWKAKEE